MSKEGNRKGASAVTEPPGRAIQPGAGARPAVQPVRTVKPVQIWAAIGGALLVLELYVWIRWVSGPYFQRVPAGPPSRRG